MNVKCNKICMWTSLCKNQRRNGNIFVTLQDLPRNLYIENVDIFQFQSGKSKSIIFSPKQFSIEMSNGRNKEI